MTAGSLPYVKGYCTYSRVAAICERILYILDGEIRGELKLGKYAEGDSRVREQKTVRWLEDMGW